MTTPIWIWALLRKEKFKKKIWICCGSIGALIGHGVDPYLGLDGKEAQVQLLFLLLLAIYLIILFRIYLLVFLGFIY